MKKIIYTLIAVFCIGITACDQGEPLVIPQLDIVESTVDFEAIGGKGFITLASLGEEVNASSSTEWCSIQNVTGNKITFNVTENAEITTRTAIIRVTAGAITKQVAITQIGLVAQYERKDFYSYPDNVAFTEPIKFTSSLPIAVTIDNDWLSYTETEEGFQFKAEENTSGKARMGKATVKSGDISIDYCFLQYGIEGLCKEWDATYSDGEAMATDKFTITQTGENELNISIAELGYQRISAIYEDGAIKIPCGQIIATKRMQNGSTYYIALGTLNRAETQAGLSENITCQLVPYLNNKTKQWGLTFVDNGSWQYDQIGIVNWALTSTGSLAGYWDKILNLCLN